MYEALKKARASHVVVGRRGYPFAEVHTTDIAYYRLHGPGRVCASAYDDAWLGTLAQALLGLAARGTTSFTFFNNDVGGRPVRNAETLKRLVSR